MLELSGELRFPDKARRDLGIPGVFRDELFDGHFPIQLPIAGQPDSADPSHGVETGKDIACLGVNAAKPGSRRRRIRGTRHRRGVCRDYRRLRLDPWPLFIR